MTTKQTTRRPVIVKESVLVGMFETLGSSPTEEDIYNIRRKIADILNGFRFNQPQSRTKPIVITVEGGCIQNIDNPYNVEIIIKDYDTDGCDGPNIKHDQDGTEYFEGIWYNNH